MTDDTTTPSTTLRTYRVLYAVTRGEYYEIEAASPEDAEDEAFTDGQYVDGGDATDVLPCEVEEVEMFSASDPMHARADCAADVAAALEHCQARIGTNDADALRDVLSALLHWSDCNDVDFEAACTRAQGHGDAATALTPEPT